ncbi:MAG: LAGLIDADG family homing endonuclease, partial [Candidatus Nanohalobium sp.]
RIPEKIVRSSDETLAGFLRGYFEAEAHVNLDKSHIEIVSKSEDIMEQVATGLKRFGIFSRFRDKEIEGETYHRLFIGPEYLEQFRESIGFISQEKSSALEEALKGPNNSNVDLVPSEDILRKAKEAANFHDREIAERAEIRRRSVSRYLKGERTPSREAFENMISAFDRRMKELAEIEEQLEDLSEELSSTSREEARDRVLEAIESGEVDRKTIEQETGISSGLISHWKQGSVPGSSTLSEASQVLEEKGIETGYSELEYDRVFESIRRIRKDLKVTPSEIKEETGIDIEVYESKERETSKERVESIVSYLREKCRDSLEDLPRELDKLERAGSSDIVWDRVEEIESFEPETDWVYDLTVPEDHTFVADDLVAHNTSLLNVLTPFMPPSQRIISIEDTRELSLPEFLHWVP